MDIRRGKNQVKTNLENATPEQKEQLMDNVIRAYQYLYKSAAERRLKELIKD